MNGILIALANSEMQSSPSLWRDSISWTLHEDFHYGRRNNKIIKSSSSLEKSYWYGNNYLINRECSALKKAKLRWISVWLSINMFVWICHSPTFCFTLSLTSSALDVEDQSGRLPLHMALSTFLVGGCLFLVFSSKLCDFAIQKLAVTSRPQRLNSYLS